MNELALILTGLISIWLLILLVILVRRKPDETVTKLKASLSSLENRHQQTEHIIKDEISRNREETAGSAKNAREELGKSFKDFSDSLLKRVTENAGMQKGQLDSFSKQLGDMTKLNEDKLEAMRLSMENQLRALQKDNNKKLEQMRATVDEKLQSTLEKRLGESFKQVSERLEQVYKGLGEMRTLATGVGDLKKVLTNVKTRGTWGEIQLGNILEQILTQDQY